MNSLILVVVDNFPGKVDNFLLEAEGTVCELISLKKAGKTMGSGRFERPTSAA